MITNLEMTQLFPKYILNDHNGYALAMAFRAGLKYFLEKSQEGLDILKNVDKMPEWRLNELAWEYNCLYDYEADISVKREWIRNAYRAYKIHGTPEGVRQYLKIYFGESSIDELFNTPDGAFLFDVNVTGIRTEKSEEWIRKAVKKAKNVRSGMRNIVFHGGESEAELLALSTTTGMEFVIESQMMN